MVAYEKLITGRQPEIKHRRVFGWTRRPESRNEEIQCEKQENGICWLRGEVDELSTVGCKA